MPRRHARWQVDFRSPEIRFPKVVAAVTGIRSRVKQRSRRAARQPCRSESRSYAAVSWRSEVGASHYESRAEPEGLPEGATAQSAPSSVPASSSRSVPGVNGSTSSDAPGASEVNAR